ncbi:MAG: PAS domain S-box protein [Chlorobium sp.]|nr:MAG: PAS domain S-box protein [Chlorobium sp.]
MQVKASLRLGAITGSVIFISVFASLLVFGLQVKERIHALVREELHRDLLFNAELLSEKPSEWDDPAFPAGQARKIGQMLDVRVTFIDTGGRIIGDSSLPLEKLHLAENHADRPEFRSALEKGFGEDSRYSRTVREKMLYLAVPLGKGHPYAVMRFAKPLYQIGIFGSGIEDDLERALIFLLIFSILAGTLLAVFFRRPLRDLAETAEKRVRGDFSGSAAVDHGEETGRIARAINYLSDEINRMRFSGEWYRAAFSGIREAVIVTDTNGDIILVNPAASRKFRIEGAMLKSRPLKNLGDRELRELLEKVHAERSILLKEEFSLLTDKGARIMQVSTMPITKDEKFQGMVFVLNDITRLRNLERMRRDFVSSVSHELRTPLSSIKGYTETLLEGAISDPEYATAFLQIILQESEQLEALVNDVLDLSKIESGRIEYHFKPVSIANAVNRSVELLRRQIEQKQIRLDVTIPEDLPPVFADEEYLDIIVRNLLDNAIKYVDDRNGKIRISAFRSGDSVHLDVEDNGIGISTQDLDRIFERFYRVDKARSRKSGGTGLGLSIVKHIVLAHRGNITVRSRLNQGSVFSVILPVASEKQERVEKRQAI